MIADVRAKPRVNPVPRPWLSPPLYGKSFIPTKRRQRETFRPRTALRDFHETLENTFRRLLMKERTLCHSSERPFVRQASIATDKFPRFFILFSFCWKN
jgi:hypothetical protein